jgi:hypothetical protein
MMLEETREMLDMLGEIVEVSPLPRFISAKAASDFAVELVM